MTGLGGQLNSFDQRNPVAKLRFVANAERVNGKAENPFCVLKQRLKKIHLEAGRHIGKLHPIAASRQALRHLRLAIHWVRE
jgi:hypothetical protein